MFSRSFLLAQPSTVWQSKLDWVKGDPKTAREDKNTLRRRLRSLKWYAVAPTVGQDYGSRRTLHWCSHWDCVYECKTTTVGTWKSANMITQASRSDTSIIVADYHILPSSNEGFLCRKQGSNLVSSTTECQHKTNMHMNPVLNFSVLLQISNRFEFAHTYTWRYKFCFIDVNYYATQVVIRPRAE